MKATKFLKLYLWAEVGFVGYLLLRKKPLSESLPVDVSPEQKQTLDDVQTAVKEKIAP